MSSCCNIWNYTCRFLGSWSISTPKITQTSVSNIMVFLRISVRCNRVKSRCTSYNLRISRCVMWYRKWSLNSLLNWRSNHSSQRINICIIQSLFYKSHSILVRSATNWTLSCSMIRTCTTHINKINRLFFLFFNLAAGWSYIRIINYLIWCYFLDNWVF